jgi:hypothetical protein
MEVAYTSTEHHKPLSVKSYPAWIRTMNERAKTTIPEPHGTDFTVFFSVFRRGTGGNKILVAILLPWKGG